MRKILLLLVCIYVSVVSFAKTLEGVVIDKITREPLPGTTVIIAGTTIGVITDFDGKFILTDIKDNKVSLIVSFVGYKSQQFTDLALNQDVNTLTVELEEDIEEIAEVKIVGRKIMGSVVSLNNERINATASIENLGTQEMAMKGISNVEDGVKKMTGIAFSSGQLFVRGLGDRYSVTTLNGLPIASPNPDNKIIPLNLFPSSTISNITVSKVFQASTFADYSGAHINIDTRENIGRDFFKIGISTGGQFPALANSFYKSDINGMFKSNGVSSEIKDMSYLNFYDYAATRDVFGTGFGIDKISALPDMGISLSGGKSFELGEHELNVLLSGSMSNGYKTKLGAFRDELNDQGRILSHFNYDSYSQEVETSALVGIGYSFNQENRINYTLFYTRNAEDNWKLREGYDAEDYQLVGSNSTYRSYALLNNQLTGKHTLTDQLSVLWKGSYSRTTSDEPDRRQVMYERNDDGSLSIFDLNQKETMRYFSELSEDELVGDVQLKYDFMEKNSVKFGVAYKSKERDFSSVSFFYNYDNLMPVINDVYSAGDFLTQENVANGNLMIKLNSLREGNYFAGADVYAAFAEVDYNITDRLLLGAGLRYEQSEQWVKYWLEGTFDPEINTIDEGDIFPGVNLKYSLSEKRALRLAFSKTVTRPSFIEMAPFRYEESYGSRAVRGNADIQNSYNYNYDLRYEMFSENTKDMFSITGYYKQLDNPIERVQGLEGASVVHTFRNVDKGVAAGVEMEFKKSVTEILGIGFNASYMYTNVNLGEEISVYTDQNRALQGAAPYLINADIVYQPRLNKDDAMLSMSLLYNYEGERIDAVGILGMSNVYQKATHTLNYVSTYKINSRWDVNLKVNNLLNYEHSYIQEVDNRDIIVGEERKGVSFSVGVSFNL